MADRRPSATTRHAADTAFLSMTNSTRSRKCSTALTVLGALSSTRSAKIVHNRSTKTFVSTTSARVSAPISLASKSIVAVPSDSETTIRLIGARRTSSSAPKLRRRFIDPGESATVRTSNPSRQAGGSGTLESTNRTRCPPRAQQSAALAPTIPPPVTMASKSNI